MDDEEMVRDVSEQIMENIDYKVLLARNGKEDMDHRSCGRSGFQQTTLWVCHVSIPARRRSHRTGRR